MIDNSSNVEAIINQVMDLGSFDEWWSALGTDEKNTVKGFVRNRVNQERQKSMMGWNTLSYWLRVWDKIPW